MKLLNAFFATAGLLAFSSGFKHGYVTAQLSRGGQHASGSVHWNAANETSRKLSAGPEVSKASDLDLVQVARDPSNVASPELFEHYHFKGDFLDCSLLRTRTKQRE